MTVLIRTLSIPLSCLALGGLAMRPYVDDDEIKISFVQAPVFYPLQSTQDASSAAIINKSQKTVGKEQSTIPGRIANGPRTRNTQSLMSCIVRAKKGARCDLKINYPEIYEDPRNK